MASWEYEKEVFTAGGNPKQYYYDEGSHVFVYRATRIGGDDREVPRRVIGIGNTRQTALNSLARSILAVDPAAILPKS